MVTLILVLIKITPGFYRPKFDQFLYPHSISVLNGLVNKFLVECVLSHFSHVRLCDPVDSYLSGFSVHGILEARILKWVAMTSPRNLPDPGIEPASLMSPALAGGFFTTSTTWEGQFLVILLI